MREVVSVHVGQAGVQIGDVCWELYCLEHKIDPTGHLMDGKLSDGFSSFFQELRGQKKYVPLVLMVDLDPTVIDQVKCGPHSKLYRTNQLLSGYEDAANNFARGKYTIGSEVAEETLDEIRRMTDSCDSIQGFMLFHSLGGGSGSGFGCLMAQELSYLYPKIVKLGFVISPSPEVSTAIVEPYNAVLACHDNMDSLDLLFMADNEAMYGICQKQLEIDRPMYRDLNRLLAQAVSSVTASLRFSGPLNVDLREFHTNLVPYPRVHFPLISYAPIFNNQAAHQCTTVQHITKACLNHDNQLVVCHTKNGQYMSCCLLYRGNVVPKDVTAAITMIKETKVAKFVEWSPTGFKIGITNHPPSVFQDDPSAKLSKAVCMNTNTTAIKEAWAEMVDKFNLMYKRKAFVHWFLSEGLCESEFVESRDDILALENDYMALESPSLFE